MTWRLVDRWTVPDASKWPAGGFSVGGPPLHLARGDLLVVRVADCSGHSRDVPFRRVCAGTDLRAVAGVELKVCPDWSWPVSVRLFHGAGAVPRDTI